jgi:hypothetical protein
MKSVESRSEPDETLLYPDSPASRIECFRADEKDGKENRFFLSPKA